MAHKLFEKNNAITILIPTITLIFLPSNYDSFNLPKLIAFILILNFLVLVNINLMTIPLRKWTKKLIYVAVLLVTLGTLKSIDVSSAILGNYAQNTGWLTLMSCISLAVFLLKLENKKLTSKLMLSLAGTGVFVAIYAFIQKLGLDPIKWTAEKWIISTLGNPNFTSSFLAISCLISLTFWNFESQPIKKFMWILSAITTSIGCYLANSDQGYAVIVVGIFIIVILNVQRLKNLKLKRLCNIVLITSVVVSAVILYTINEKFLVLQLSLKYRIYYWEASWDMFVNNILFGVGFGNFEDSFFRYRSLNHYLNGRGEFAASSHNYFLELFSLGGVLLGSGYLLYCGYVSILLIKIIKKSPIVEAKNVQLLGVSWIAFLLQSSVSIPVIPFLVIGTVTSILIIKTNDSIKQTSQATEASEEIFKKFLRGKSIRMVTLFTLIINLIVSTALILQDQKLKTTIDFVPKTTKDLTSKKVNVKNLTGKKIYREEYKYLLAKNLFNQGFGYEGEVVMKDASNNALHAYNKYWYLGYFNLNLNKTNEAIMYLKFAKELDPVNLNIRRDLVLLLRLQKDVKNASSELEELRKLSPNSEQYKSLVNKS